jgi:Mrp family chromosome partitioning ATPase
MGLLIGGLMGVVLGIAFAFILETLDTSIATIEDVENTMKLAVLGTVPSIGHEFQAKQGIIARLKGNLFHIPKTDAQERFIHLVGHYKPKSLAAEAFRNIRTNLKLDQTKKTILVTSSNPREGKSTIVTNLGIAMAQMSARVLLVSADLRRPSLAKIFGVKRDPGLTELLSGAVDIDTALRSITDVMLGDMQIDEIINRPPGLENVWVLTSGRLPSNPAEILEMKKIPELLDELKRRFDVIIFDSPPVLPVTDASLLAPKMDSVIIVYEIGRTSREALARTKIQLESVGAKIAGAILNNTRSQTESASSYYHYQSKYAYYGKDDAKDTKDEGPDSAG